MDHPDMILTKEHSLKDILARPELSAVTILLTTPLTPSTATELAGALKALAIKVRNTSFTLVLICKCSRDTAKIVSDGVRDFKGLENVAIVLNAEPGPASRLAQEVAIEARWKPIKPFPFTQLPREIRHNIISHVYNRRQGKSIAISEVGQRYCCNSCLPQKALREKHCACRKMVGGYSTSCICYTNRFALFRVSKVLYADSTFVAFSDNRFLLTGLSPSLNFLQRLPSEALKVIRKLDLRFDFHEYALYMENVPQAFQDLVEIISKKCTLSNLHLSVDAGHDDEQFAYIVPEDVMPIKTAWWNIIKALESLKGRGLDRFEVYLSKYHELEPEMEKHIMGEEYDACTRGKLNWKIRDQYCPHEHREQSVDEKGNDSER